MPESADSRIATRGAVLAFDFGLARIGIATGELETRTASPLLTLAHSPVDARFATIARLLAEWQPVMEDITGPIEALVEDCTSLEELLVRLPQVVGQANEARLIEALVKGMAKARALGDRSDG